MASENGKQSKEIPKEVVSALRNFISAYTRNRPYRPNKPANVKNPILTKDERGFITELCNNKISPRDAVDIIFNNPPTVYSDIGIENTEKIVEIEPKQPIIVIDPTENEKKYLEKNIPLDPKLFNTLLVEKLDAFLNQCKSYLNTPIIKDDFGVDHESRRNWEQGIKDSLNAIGEEWGMEFKDRWDMNRYTKNRRTTLVTGITFINRALTQSIALELSGEIKPFLSRIENDINLAQKIFMETNIDQGVDFFNKVCAKTVDFFFEKSTITNQEVIQRRPENHKRFISLLYQVLQEKKTLGNQLPDETYFYNNAESYLGENNKQIFELIDLISRYQWQTFTYVSNTIKEIKVPDSIKGSEKGSILENSIQEAVKVYFIDALAKPYLPKGTTQYPVKVTEELKLKISNIIKMIAHEVYKGEATQANLMPKVLIEPKEGFPITFEYLTNPQASLQTQLRN